ncbi:MAG: hypothetical protein ACYCYI_09470 [Saccharofermentanales bacterium]
MITDNRESTIAKLMQESRFDFVNEDDKAFITAFDAALLDRGWGIENNGHFKGYCWGRYMFIYCKLGVKAKKVAARIYLRDDNIVLRLFLNGMDKHRTFLESAPEHIKRVFLPGGGGDCHHCPDGGSRVNGKCMFRKNYTIDGQAAEKCNGAVFEYHQPAISKLPDYLALLDEFYPTKGKK